MFPKRLHVAMRNNLCAMLHPSFQLLLIFIQALSCDRTSDNTHSCPAALIAWGLASTVPGAHTICKGVVPRTNKMVKTLLVLLEAAMHDGVRKSSHALFPMLQRLLNHTKHNDS